MLDRADIEAALGRLDGQLVRTPMHHSKVLSELTGARIFVKFENHQFTASFKERGALNKLMVLTPDERRAGVAAMSAGNHAQAVAYHAKRLGIAALIVMPRSTPFSKVEQTRSHGAEVVLIGDTLADAQVEAVRLNESRGATFVHPYDDPHIMAGQGTVAVEMLADEPALDTIVVPIGGGGLIAGIATAAQAIKPGVEIVGVQTQSYPSMLQALQGDEAVCSGNTVAEGIAVKYAGRLTREIIRTRVASILLVDEATLEHAVALYLNVEKTVAEGAGAASLACVLAHPEQFRGKSVGLVLSGGNIDPRLLSSIILRELVRERRIVTVRMPIADRPGILALVAAAIADAGANILEIHHSRTSLALLAKDASLEITFEARDGAHAELVVKAIRDAGFEPQVVAH